MQNLFIISSPLFALCTIGHNANNGDYVKACSAICMAIAAERSPRLTQSRLLIVIVISRFLKRYLKAKRTRAPAYSRALRRIKGWFPKRSQENPRSGLQDTRRDRVAVKVGFDEIGRVNDQMDQGMSVWRDDILGWRWCLMIGNDGGGDKEMVQSSGGRSVQKRG